MLAYMLPSFLHLTVSTSPVAVVAVQMHSVFYSELHCLRNLWYSWFHWKSVVLQFEESAQRAFDEAEYSIGTLLQACSSPDCVVHDRNNISQIRALNLVEQNTITPHKDYKVSVNYTARSYWVNPQDCHSWLVADSSSEKRRRETKT